MTEQHPRQPGDSQHMPGGQRPERQGQRPPVNDEERDERDRADVDDVDDVDNAIEDARESEGLSEQPD